VITLRICNKHTHTRPGGKDLGNCELGMMCGDNQRRRSNPFRGWTGDDPSTIAIAICSPSGSPSSISFVSWPIACPAVSRKSQPNGAAAGWLDKWMGGWGSEWKAGATKIHEIRMQKKYLTDIDTALSAAWAFSISADNAETERGAFKGLREYKCKLLI